MKNKLGLALISSIVFQLLILIGMQVKAAMPLWTGVEIKVKTIPVDPRSMFRGNYARLSYEFSRIDSSHFSQNNYPGNGDEIYVVLKLGDNGIYKFSKISLNKPEDGIFLSGRIENKYGIYRVKYGIEAFFAPKKKALELERKLRKGGIAVLMISSDGKARIKNIISE